MANKSISIWLRLKNGMAAGLARAEAGLAKFGKKAKRMASKVTKSLLAIGASAVGLGAYFVKAASDAEETGTKFDAVFSSVLATANKTADALSKDFDLAGSTARKLLGDTGDLLVGFGFAEDEAIKLADATNRLAIDLASFTNYSGGAAGASQALTKLLLGETEQAKSLGIVVRQSSAEYKDAVAAKMADLGVTELQAKAMTALEMAQAQSTKAQGDYERTQGGVANQTRKVAERFKEFREEIGKTIMESADLPRLLAWIADNFKRITGAVRDWSKGGGLAVATAQTKIFGLEFVYRLKLIKLNSKIAFSALSDSAETIMAYVTGVVVSNINLWVAQFNYFKDLALAVWEAIKHPIKTGFVAPDTTAMVQAIKDVAAAAKAEGLSWVSDRTEAALAEREKIISAHAKKVTKVTTQLAKDLEKASAPKPEPVDDTAAMQQAAADKKRIKEKEALNKRLKELEEERTEAVKLAAKKRADEAAKEVERLKGIAQKRVQDFIDDAKQEDEARKDAAAEQKRMERLEAKAAIRGLTLSKRDQQRLEAWRKIQAAKAQLPLAEAKAKEAEQEMLKVQGKQLRELEAIKQEQHDTNKKLADLLVMQ
jgi:hypothetical protein